jgi:hypothetical protein
VLFFREYGNKHGQYFQDIPGSTNAFAKAEAEFRNLVGAEGPFKRGTLDLLDNVNSPSGDP